MNILNIGSGPVTVGHIPGIDFTHADHRAYPGVSYQDMEKISCPDNSFDLVVCINALDHTKDAKKAVKEMVRVSKSWVYIDCALIQHTTSGKGHYWDMLEDGTLKSGDTQFNLKDFGFKIELIDNGIERRYNHIIARMQK